MCLNVYVYVYVYLMCMCLFIYFIFIPIRSNVSKVLLCQNTCHFYCITCLSVCLFAGWCGFMRHPNIKQSSYISVFNVSQCILLKCTHHAIFDITDIY